MPPIVIISSSVRRERKSHNVALYFKTYLEENNLSTSEILDLKQYNFPIFEDNLKALITSSINKIILRLKEEGFDLSKNKLTKQK